MAKYHKFLGENADVEAMYQAEDAEEFDAWYQSDLRPMGYRLLSTTMNAFCSIRFLTLVAAKVHKHI